MLKLLLIISFLLASFASFPLFSQSLLESSTYDAEIGNPKVVDEKVLKISPSGKILIITNTNNILATGDFISLLMNNQLTVRALVAKINEENLVGIKLLKIYSQALYEILRPGVDIQVLKGDDSYFRPNELNGATSVEADLSIQDVDDLYNSTMLEGEEIDENQNRIIKPDNIVGAIYGMVEGVNNDKTRAFYGQFAGMWSYQLADNIWLEAGFGRHVIRDFPSAQIDTEVNNLFFKLKYTIAAPFYSYVLPYIGFQLLTASSPGAGVQTPDINDNEYYQNEIDLVESLTKRRPVIGITVLKRVVPGWFLRAELGLDILAFGASLEF